jgi:myosin-3
VLTGKMDVNTMDCMHEYYRRWKSKTIFQVLLMYRAAKLQDLVYFAQQVSYEHFRAFKMYRAFS